MITLNLQPSILNPQRQIWTTLEMPMLDKLVMVVKYSELGMLSWGGRRLKLFLG